MKGRISRYLVLNKEIELRIYASPPELQITEVYVTLPIETYWELSELIKRVNYERSQGFSGEEQWQKIIRLVSPYVVTERDRVWFKENVS